jgi:hypothetical protein
VRAPTVDPRDLTGLWWAAADTSYEHQFFKPDDGSGVPFTAAGRAIFDQRRKAVDDGVPIRDPATECMPHGVPRINITLDPFLILQTPGQVTFVHERGHDIRLVYMNEKHPANLKPSFMGHSVGHWEGDTLVIETVGLRSDVWLDTGGAPGSEQLRVIERLKKTDGGKRLVNTFTIIDPVNYTKPWTASREYLWRPEAHPEEYFCEENTQRAEPGARREIYQ